VVEATPLKLDLRWAALLHDIAKPFVRTENKNGYSNYINHEILGADIVEKLSRHLKFSNDRREYIVDLVKNHLNDDCELREYDNKCKNYDR
jgi:tRNA nucleotidyltransferase (CCA-adding enzyme)